MLKVKDKYDYRRELCEALRSGKFEQCTHRMSHNGAYCALGVAQVIGIIENDLQDFEDKCGLRPGKIANLNDFEMTFTQIADWIEAQP